MWNTCRKLNSTAPRAGIQGPAGGFISLDATEEEKVAEEGALGCDRLPCPGQEWRGAESREARLNGLRKYCLSAARIWGYDGQPDGFFAGRSRVIYGFRP